MRTTEIVAGLELIRDADDSLNQDRNTAIYAIAKVQELEQVAAAARSALETPGDLTRTEIGYIIDDLDAALNPEPTP